VSHVTYLGHYSSCLICSDVTDIFGGSCVGKLYADDIKLYSVSDNPLDYSENSKLLSSIQATEREIKNKSEEVKRSCCQFPVCSCRH